VDGTPEYSFYIYGLRKLFPDAVFIHVLRNVGDVVRSMLNMHRLAGSQLVANEEEAYRYWLRTVQACVQAERAYGSNVVRRFAYNAMIEQPESAIRSMLDFVGESFCAECLEPLSCQINSSDVPPDFVADDPATDPRVVEEATNLYVELQKTPQPDQSSSAAAAELEAAFTDRVQYLATLDNHYQQALQIIRNLEENKASESAILRNSVKAQTTGISKA
jgi:hypothetical protein